MTRDTRLHAAAALGLFLVLLGLYVATSPGRIDIIDGQFRYEVARNWLDRGRPVLLDPNLIPMGLAVVTRDGAYAVYNAAPSIAAMPLMLLSRALPYHASERDRFFFAMTGPVVGALLGSLLVVAYAMLGVPLPLGVTCALVAGLATSWWPGSTTVFDQNQHAVWLLAALLLAWTSARRARAWPAALGGIAGGVLVNYQESYALLLPLVGLAVASTTAPGPGQDVRLAARVDRESLERYAVFGLGCAAGLAAFGGFNHLRFGTFLTPGRYDNPLIFGLGQPIAALVGLVASPGKSVFLYSPPIVLAALGATRLLRRAPGLGLAIAGATILHVLVVMQLAFFGGDWCWGPRYLLVLIPMWALAFPFALAKAGRGLATTLVGAGLAVQLVALSLDHQRFFFERDLAPHFWALDPWFHLRHSQLGARIGEVASTWRQGVPGHATAFSPTPTREITYAPFGLPPNQRTSDWVRQFAVFYVPRPWPLWISRLDDPARRPIEPWPWLLLCGTSVTVGCGATWWAVRGSRRER